MNALSLSPPRLSLLQLEISYCFRSAFEHHPKKESKHGGFNCETVKQTGSVSGVERVRAAPA